MSVFNTFPKHTSILRPYLLQASKMATRNHHNVCYMVPPYLLNAIAESSNNEDPIRESARNALSLHKSCIGKREKRFTALTTPRGFNAAGNVAQHRSIVPDHMLQHIADCQDVDSITRDCAKRDLEHIRNVHAKYQQAQGLRDESSDQKTLAATDKSSETTEKTYRAVYDAQNDEKEANLPGKLVRVEGQAATKDESVNEAYDNAGHVLSFYADIFNWKSIDNKNMHVVSSVHFGKNYENAFWDPEIAQMVYGDGHTFLTNFTGCVDVIGHELTVRDLCPL